MRKQKLSLSIIVPVGLMLFSFFFGAGNLIFPPTLGQAAGSNLMISAFAFCISAVGLPLLAVLAIAITRSDNPDILAFPAGNIYAKVVTVLCALTIGPLFAIPRTAAVSFDTGVLYLLPEGYGVIGLAGYSAFFFIVTYLLSVNQSKIVDNIGKIITPMLLFCLAVLFGLVIFDPMGALQAPLGDYQTVPFFKGFQEGYQTMDLLGAVLLGAAAVKTIESIGITEHKQLTEVCAYSGLVAAFCLTVVYMGLAYAGASSMSVIGEIASGGKLLNHIAVYYLGNFGQYFLALIIFFACITTSIGLTSAIAGYFADQIERCSFRFAVAAICIVSFVISNVGLVNIIKFSIPVIFILYPILIALVMLNVFQRFVERDPMVFRCCAYPTSLFAIFDGLRAAGIDTGAINAFLEANLPLYSIGFGWLIPCVAGLVIGFMLKGHKVA